MSTVGLPFRVSFSREHLVNFRKHSVNFRVTFSLTSGASQIILQNMFPDRYEQVAEGKAQGAWNLHAATEGLTPPLAHFVMMSSTSAALGNPGQVRAWMCPACSLNDVKCSLNGAKGSLKRVECSLNGTYVFHICRTLATRGRSVPEGSLHVP
jgi:hypothetical protein